MDTKTANQMFRKHAAAVACIEVADKNGDLGVGAAFHVGDGVFLTARHVVEGMSISSIHSTEMLLLPPEEAYPDLSDEQIEEWSRALGFTPLTRTPTGPMKLAGGPYFHPDDSADIAALKVDHVHPKLPYVELGTHLDDWIKDEDWVLSEAIVLGYPPIPLTTSTHLVAVRAEINAVIGMMHSRNVHFIISAMPRGGFSGGLVLSEFGFALGMVTQSLVKDGGPAEMGFFTVTSVEPLYECLAHHKMLPEIQKEKWGGFWNTKSLHYTGETGSGLMVASLGYHDDGKQIYIDWHAHADGALLNRILRSIISILNDVPTRVDQKRDDWARVLLISYSPDAIKRAADAVEAADLMLLDNGLRHA
jgi:hypothetical protein